jgi:hypothetical protein
MAPPAAHKSTAALSGIVQSDEWAFVGDRARDYPRGAAIVNREGLMARRFVDLSIYLENDVLSDPPMLAPRIEYQNHRTRCPSSWRCCPA